MRKIWKGLKFLLCYLAITVATAAGVVVVSTNSAGNINSNNSGGNTNITQEENNLMEVVTNVMELNSFNLTSDITLTKGSQSIALNLDLDINLASNLNNIAAQGNISAIYNNEEYELDLTFVDKTVYMSALDQDLTFTVDGISQGISEALKLVSVKLPDIGESLGSESAGFDPTMLLSKMGEYTEKKSGDTITITLEFMDWDITMACDESYNLMSVDIPNINLEGFDIALKASLTEHTQKPEISKPTKQYLNLDILTNLLPYANEIKNNGYLAADLKATYQNAIIDMNMQTDFSASPIIKLTSPIFEGISLMYQDKALYTSLGNINLKTTTKDLQDLFSFIKNDMKANLNNINPEIVNTISKSAQSATTALVNSAKELSLDDMLEYLDYLSVNEDKITYALDNLYAEMNITDNKITSIYVRYDDFEFEVYNISTTKQDITLDTNEYLLFEDVFPTLKNFVNTIFKKGISGNLNIIDGSKTLSLNYGIRYTDTLETSFDTKLFNKTISLVTKNDTIFVAVDGIKLTAALGEYQEILDYINKTFGINAEVNLQAPELDLPQVSNIDLNNISLDFIQAINVIPGGIEIVINNNLTIKVESTNDYISNICVYVKDMIIDLNITSCGDIKLFAINEREYLHFEDVKRYIDNFITFAQEDYYDLDLTFRSKINDLTIAASANGQFAKAGKANLDINASINDQNIALNIFSTGDAVGVSYDGLNVYAQNDLSKKVSNIISNILPDYININQALVDNGINMDELEADIQNKTNSLAADYKNIIYSISNINLLKRSMTITVNTTKYFEEAIRLTITITMQNNGYNLFVVGTYEDTSVLISANLVAGDDFDVVIPSPAIDIEDYLDLVETLHNTIDTRNLKLGITASYGDYAVNADAIVDFSDGIKAKLTSNSLGSDLDITYIDQNNIFVKLGNIKLVCKVSEFEDLLTYLKGDFNQGLQSFGIGLVKSAVDTISTTEVVMPTITFEDIKDVLYTIDFANDKITFIKDGISITLNKTADRFTSISVAYDEVSVVITIEDNAQTITIPQDYVSFGKTYPVLTKLADTVFTQGIAGDLSLIKGGDKLTLNYGIKYADVLKTSFTTVQKGKTISVVTIGEQVYLAVDGIKLTVALSEYKEILNYISKTFGLTVEVPVPAVDTQAVTNLDLQDINIDFIQSLTLVDTGIKIVLGNGMTIIVRTSDDYISSICVEMDGYVVDLNITSCGDVSLYDINKEEYITFEDVKTYIDTALDFAKEDNFNASLNLAITTPDFAASGNISGNISLDGRFDLKLSGALDEQEVSLDLFSTGSVVGVNYDGLAVYAQNNPYSKIVNILENILPEYIDLKAMMGKIDTTELESKLNKTKVPTEIDYIALVDYLSSITLTQDTLTIAINSQDALAKQLVATITLTMLTGGYNVSVVGNYGDIIISLGMTVKAIDDFSVVMPSPAIDIEDYLDLVETLHNTVDSRNLKLGITASYDNYTVNADAIVDFRDGLVAKLTSNSLGSDLDITYIDNNNIFVKLGSIKLVCKVSEFEDLLSYVKGDLNDILKSYGINAIQKLISSASSTTEVSAPEITFEDIKDILYTINFTDDKITFVKDGISITLNKAADRFTSIAFAYENISVVITIEDNTQTISAPQGYTSFANVAHSLKAVAQSLSSHTLGADVTLTLLGDTYTGSIKLGYVNDVVMLSMATDVYGQDINVTVIDSTVYVKINELYVKVNWAERNELFSYINEKFGLNINIDKLIADMMPKQETKAFSLKDIDVSFITNFVATNNSLHINDGLADIYFGSYKDYTQDYITAINVNIDGIVASLYNMTYGNDALITLPIQANKYATYKTFTEYFDEVQRLINAANDESTNQYKLSGNIKLYKIDAAGNSVMAGDAEDAINITLNDLMFDATKNTFMGGLDATGAGSLYTNYLGGYDHSFDAGFDYNFIYFDYNGLKVKFSKQSNSEFITVLKTGLPNYLGDSKLTNQIMSLFDMISFDMEGNMIFNSMPTVDIYNMIEDYVPMLSTLRLEEDNSLTIGIDISKFVKSMKDELLINARLDQNNKLSLHISKFKIAKDLAIDFSVYVDTANEFLVAPEGSFMDMTSIGKLLGDFDNTAQSTTEDNQTYKLNFSGYIHIKLKVIGINIDKDIPFSAQLVLDRNSDSLVEGKFVVNMPSIFLVTDGGTSTLYLTDRLEGTPILYINRTGKNPLKSKYKTSELRANLLHVISDITAIEASTLETFMTMDIKYIEGPSKAENILKAYTCISTGDSRKYTIGLDLRQLTLMDMMVGYSDDNKTNVVLTSQNDVFTSLAFNNITLEAISGVYIYAYGNIDLSNITADFNFVPEIESLDPTEFGGWDDGSLVAYFEENGGSVVPNKMGSTGRNIKLPAPVKEVENGNNLEVYKFLGWSLNSDGSGTLYNDNYLFGTENLTFYAVWELDTVYTKHTITFASEVGTTPSSITTYNGYDITASLPQLPETMTIYNESVGVSITYRYDGLFLNRVDNGDGSYTYSEPWNSTVMGETDQIVYVCWTEIDRVYTRKLTIYDSVSSDNLSVKYEGYFTEGSEIDILSLVAHNDKTRWYDTYTNNTYSDMIAASDLPTVMPENDITLHIQNYYTMTFKSAYGDYNTKTVSGYQGEALNAPALSDYETIYYKDGSTTIPNYLKSYDFQGYFLNGSNYKTAMPATIPNVATTYVAKWNTFDTSYIKLTFDTGWTRANHWLNNGTEKVAPTKVDTTANGFTNEGTPDNILYVLSGSSLNGITLTRKYSALGLQADTVHQLKSTCRYNYRWTIFAANYDFKAINYNRTGKVNYNTDSYNTTNHGELTQDEKFYIEWADGKY